MYYCVLFQSCSRFTNDVGALFASLYLYLVSDTSVVEGESQIQMGRFISFLQV